MYHKGTEARQTMETEMTTFTINSRKLAREFTFFMPDNGGYVRLEDGANHGTLGRQICQGGGFQGITIYCSGEDEFRGACRRWYRAFMRAADTM